MRILLTNDDGINATGLKVLETIAQDVAGPSGEVWTVAPAFEQSGVAHSISLVHPTLLSQQGPRRFAAEGTPADCVMAGLHVVLKDTPPDLVLSGVNRGNNAGQNAAYSGTLGAAMEGALQGARAIALSQYFGPENRDLADPFEAAATHGAAVVRALMDEANWTASGFRTFYNVNFPPVSAAAVKGLQVAPQGTRETPSHSVAAHVGPNGRRYLWANGAPQQEPMDQGTDVQANLDGYIAVTPMRADFTAHDLLNDLKIRLG
ncbi:MAG: 5'/3'-nucleotidase SurE [Pseudomonadota bacterium]